MTIVTDLTDPRLQRVEGGGSVQILLGKHSLLISTPEEALALRSELAKAVNYLQERQRLVATRLDRDTAVLQNEINAELHSEWGSTLGPWTGNSATTEQRSVTIPIAACTCSRMVLCADHAGDAA